MSDIGPDEIATGSLRNRGSRSSRRVIGARQQGDEDLIRALDHKRRRQIMRLLESSEDPVGQREIEDALGPVGGNVDHHLRVLRERGLVALATTGKGGEAYYVSRVKGRATIRIFLEEQGHG